MECVKNPRLYAADLLEYAEDICKIKKQLLNYKTSLLSNWQGTETQFISDGIDKLQEDIDDTASQIKSLGEEIILVCNQLG